MTYLITIAITIAASEIMKASNNPATTAGDRLGPYLTTTFHMEHFGAFVISRPDGVFRVANAEEEVTIISEVWSMELSCAVHNPHPDFLARALSFINGPAMERAQTYLAAVDG